MNIQPMRPLLAVGLLALAACQPGGSNAAPGPITQGINEAQKGLQKASQELEKAGDEITKEKKQLATENMSLSTEGKAIPEAEITPAGELLIDGKPVTMTPEQKALGLAYRTQLQAIASDGIVIGMEGAKLGIDAAADALKSVLGGQSTEEVSQQAEAAAKDRIEPLAKHLCSLMPSLLKSQQAWAAAQPEFRPYATMDQSDVDNCRDKGVVNLP